MGDQEVQVDCIVKLGGRAVTCKEKHETSNIDAIKQAADIFRDLDRSNTNTGKYIVVHGAGWVYKKH